ncbi:MAG TPA: type II toxin-antitoxin system ParD family antitoxin [Prolixibacteraceae bacterium]|jgi:antitoxin ParD1/3/4
MGKNTSISIGKHFETFIENEVSTGKYQSASEVIRTALRLLESEENKINELRHALDLGENSKMLDRFNSEAHLLELQRRHL